MNAFDGATLAVMGLAAWRGGRRGIAQEAYRLLRLAVALGAGCGLYGLVAGAISAVTGGAAGVGGFLVAFGGAYGIVRAARRRFLGWVEARTASWPGRTAAAIGAFRGLAAMLAAAAAINVAPLPALRDRVLEGSAVGRIASVLAPAAPADGKPTGDGQRGQTEDTGEGERP